MLVVLGKQHSTGGKKLYYQSSYFLPVFDGEADVFLHQCVLLFIACLTVHCLLFTALFFIVVIVFSFRVYYSKGTNHLLD